MVCRVFAIFLLCFVFSSSTFVDAAERTIYYNGEPSKKNWGWEIFRYVAAKMKLRELFYPTGEIGPGDHKTFSSRVWKLTIEGFNEDVDIKVDDVFTDENSVSHLTIENCSGKWAHLVEKFPKLKTLLIRDSNIGYDNMVILYGFLNQPREEGLGIRSIKFELLKRDFGYDESLILDQLESRKRGDTISSFTEKFADEDEYRKYGKAFLPSLELMDDLKTFIEFQKSQLEQQEMQLSGIQFGYVEKIELEGGDVCVMIGDIHGSADALCQVLQDLVDKKYVSDDFVAADKVKIFFTGNMIERGFHSVVTLDMIFKLANKSNRNDRKSVFITCGTRELNREGNWEGRQFLDEITHKYKEDKPKKLMLLFDQAFKFFPSAYFLRLPSGDFCQVNHGGPAMYLLESEDDFVIPDWFKNLEEQPRFWAIQDKVQKALVNNKYVLKHQKTEWTDFFEEDIPVRGFGERLRINADKVGPRYKEYKVHNVVHGEHNPENPAFLERTGGGLTIWGLNSMPEALGGYKYFGYLEMRIPMDPSGTGRMFFPISKPARITCYESL